MCVTWYSNNFRLHKPIAKFFKSVGVIHIKVDGKIVYTVKKLSTLKTTSNQSIDASLSLDTALLNSIRGNKIKAVELLLTIGANPNLVIPSSGKTALEVANTMRGSRDLTVLQVACQFGHCDTVSMLLAAGDIAPHDIWTSMHIASKNGFQSIVKTLH